MTDRSVLIKAIFLPVAIIMLHIAWSYLLYMLTRILFFLKIG